MNEEVSDETEVGTLIEGPGKRLKQLRESKGLALEDVAAMLHLSEGKLIALESDDYSQLPGSVFTQGYLRNYARLMELPADPILDAFHQLNPKGESLPNIKVTHISREVRSSHGVVRFITWLIVLGLLGLVLTWWQGYLQWPMQERHQTDNETTLDQAIDKPLGDIPEHESNNLPTIDSGQSTLALPTPDRDLIQEGSVIAEEQVSVSTGGTSVENTDPPVETAEQTEVSAEPAEMPTAEAETTTLNNSASAEQQVTPEVSDSRVTINFKGDCWVSIQDASGSYKISGTQRQGKQILLEGEPPYKLILGNASSVELLVDDAPFDLVPYTSGNVAKLTLDLQ